MEEGKYDKAVGVTIITSLEGTSLNAIVNMKSGVFQVFSGGNQKTVFLMRQRQNKTQTVNGDEICISSRVHSHG